MSNFLFPGSAKNVQKPCLFTPFIKFLIFAKQKILLENFRFEFNTLKNIKLKIKNSFTKTFHFNHQLTGLYMLELNRFYVSLQAGVNKANALQFPFLLLRKIFMSISGQPKIFQNNYYVFLVSWVTLKA